MDKMVDNKIKQPSLLARLNLFDATLLVIGSVIGSGIFLTSGIIAQSLPAPGWILLVWLIGSVLSLFGGLTLAELGAMMPQAGGQYVYLREAYGSIAGFMYGWSTFWVIQTGGIAALAVGFAEYLSYFLPQLSLGNYIIDLGGITISYGQLIAAFSIAILTLINYYGIRSGSSVQNFFTILKILAIAILVIAGLLVVSMGMQSADQQVTGVIPSGTGLISAIGIALIAVLWTFDGWYSVNAVASEIKNPAKNLPLSLILGISFIGVIYLLVNVFYLQAMPMNEMIGVVRIGEKATSYLFGPSAGSAMSALILISIFGCLSATILYGPRIFYAMAKDGLFFKSFATVHTKYHSPSVAVIWQGIWSGLLCLSGSYEQLYTYVVCATLIFFMAAALAVFVLRKRHPDARRPYRLWGYPVVPILFGLSMLFIAINSLIEKPLESLIGIIIILIGLPVYWYWRNHE
jgi:APA family basic amino acid/polyamine antiporter